MPLEISNGSGIDPFDRSRKRVRFVTPRIAANSLAVISSFGRFSHVAVAIRPSRVIWGKSASAEDSTTRASSDTILGKRRLGNPRLDACTLGGVFARVVFGNPVDG